MQTLVDITEGHFISRNRKLTAEDIEDLEDGVFEVRRSSKDRSRGTDRNGFERKRDTCVISDEIYEEGESAKYPGQCVEILCERNGNVELVSLDNNDCRRRSSRDRGANRDTDFS